MDIDRRRLLRAGACLTVTGLVSSFDASYSVIADEISHEFMWQPLTRSLLDRARRANATREATNMVRVERIIREEAGAQGWTKDPVIKWQPDPAGAFDHLSRYGLDALLGMDNASLWRRSRPSVAIDDRSSDLSLGVLGGLVGEIVGAEEHDRALMAPKLLAKAKAMAGNASAEAVFKVRAAAAQIGWLETGLPAVAGQAVLSIEILLALGFSEHGEPVHHHLKVFEIYELGLLATWETPSAIICVPRRSA